MGKIDDVQEIRDPWADVRLQQNGRLTAANGAVIFDGNSVHQVGIEAED